MNVFWQVAMLSLQKRKRRCPRCNHLQLAPWGKEDRSVRCEHCGAVIPPKKG